VDAATGFAPLGANPLLGYAPTMDPASDEALMLRYADGDATAFEALYERYRAPLYRYFLRQTKNPATANDLYQGCWEKVIRGRSRYRPQAPFRAWLFRVAHNHLVDHHRGNREVLPLTVDPPAEDGHGAAEELDRKAQADRLRAALATLPPEQREAFLLRVEGGFDVARIGDITGVGAETAKSRLRYASRKLKQLLS
jgi:RNA polymerase sigma-70 factor (ECF subfamily)